MAGNKDFSWRWSPARGHSGGMILGIRNDDLEIEQVESATFFWLLRLDVGIQTLDSGWLMFMVLLA